MSRMCDRMMRYGFIKHPLNDMAAHSPEAIKLALSTATIIQIDNVAKYFFEQVDRDPGGTWDYKKDFPNVAPPFNAFWMEFSVTRESTLSKAGLLFMAEELDDSQKNDEVNRYIFGGSQLSARWVMTCLVFAEKKDGVIHGPIADIFIPVDRSGLMSETSLETPIRTVFLWPPCYDGPDEHTRQTIAIMLAKTVYPALMALSFLHCKNVTLVKNEPKPLGRAAIRRKQRPSMTFYTLEIEPMKRVLRTEGQSETTGLKRALHVCRGHFADYSKHGLFGKVKGVFWREAHVRGSASEGAVLKDYSVKAKA